MDFKPNLRNNIWKKGWKDLPECYVQVKVPGLTSVTNDMIPDPDLDKWIQDVGEEKAKQITEAAHQRGTSMHMFIENFLKNIKETKDPGAALKYTQIETPRLLEEQEKIPQDKIAIGRDLFYKLYYSDEGSALTDVIQTELPLYSPKLYFRGYADLFYKRKGFGAAVSDFKTSNKLIVPGTVKERKYKLQLGGYSSAIEHMFKADGQDLTINYASIICILTKADRVQEIKLSFEELQEYKDEFASIVKEWHIKKGQGFLFN